MNLLRCEGVCKAFDGVPALVAVELEFPSSGIAALIGPNGAGKTTLLNVMTGFLSPEKGRCFLGDREISHTPAHTIVRLGVARTFQDVRLIFQASVLDNVVLGRPHQRGERLLPALLHFGVAVEEARNREEGMRLLTFVGLDGYARALAGELSYGQQKLLTLACCLATDARILLLDEPVAGVHPDMAERIARLLRQLCDSGKAIVCIEHDMSFVRQTANLVIVMDEGRIIAKGPPGEVLERPEIVEAYIG